MTDKPEGDRALDRSLSALLREELARGGDDCPSPAALAAHYDGAMTAGEAGSIEQHLAGCGRCQAQVAALVRLDPEPASVTGAETRRAASTSRRRSWAWFAAPLALAATAVLAVLSLRGNPPAAPVASDRRAAPPAASVPEPRAEADKAAPGVPAVAPERQRPSADSGDARNQALSARPAAPESAPQPARKEEKRDAAAEASATAATRADQIVARDSPRVIWRLHGSAIDRSDDAGATWRPQQSATTRVLKAGSAPSAEACWVAGAAGTVLRTTDGEHWRPTVAPTEEDLVAIRAADATNATVETASGKRFSTTDGGRKWSTP